MDFGLVGYIQAWKGGLTPENIRNGFRACGIHPFDPSAVLSIDFGPSEPTDVRMQPTTETQCASTHSLTSSSKIDENRISEVTTTNVNCSSDPLNPLPLALPSDKIFSGMPSTPVATFL